jgi:hypothetical protein
MRFGATASLASWAAARLTKPASTSAHLIKPQSWATFLCYSITSSVERSSHTTFFHTLTQRYMQPPILSYLTHEARCRAHRHPPGNGPATPTTVLIVARNRRLPALALTPIRAHRRPQ